MNKLFWLVLLLAVYACTALAQNAPAASQPSLGELARKARTQQKPAAIARYDEESFRNSAPSAPDDSAKPDDQNKSAKADQAKPADKDKDNQSDWKTKIDAQKNEVAMLQREIDVAQREQRLRAAAFYGDAGTQLRDQGKFADESHKQQEDIDTKKQALEAAQQKLSDLEEEARKSGSPQQ